jgi:hypothetical protein
MMRMFHLLVGLLLACSCRIAAAKGPILCGYQIYVVDITAILWVFAQDWLSQAQPAGWAWC